MQKLLLTVKNSFSMCIFLFKNNVYFHILLYLMNFTEYDFIYKYSISNPLA